MKAVTESMTGVQKAAILMVMLGDDVASSLYRHLPERDVQEITREIAQLEFIEPEVGINVLNEYYRLTKTQEYVAQGGEDFAKKLLVKAFGAEAAKDLLEQVERAQEAKASHLDSLRRADPV